MAMELVGAFVTFLAVIVGSESDHANDSISCAGPCLCSLRWAITAAFAIARLSFVRFGEFHDSSHR